MNLPHGGWPPTVPLPFPRTATLMENQKRGTQKRQHMYMWRGSKRGESQSLIKSNTQSLQK